MRIQANILAAFIIALPFVSYAQIPATTGNSPNQVTPPQLAPAATKKSKRIAVDTKKTITINYGHPGWNKSSTSIDSATVIMRDGDSGRIVQIQLNETAPDSSIFSGRYSINFQNVEQLQTEFFIPSQEQISAKDGLLKITAKIAAGEIQRNPFIMRKLSSGEQSVEIFDTREQARQAAKLYRVEQQTAALQNRQVLTSPVAIQKTGPSEQDLEAQRIAEEARRKAEAARAASDRLRLEQLEAKRLEVLKAQQAALSLAAKAEQKKRANRIGEEALALYRDGDFAGARKKFDEALSLDPDNRAFYFQFGVTLYKTGDTNRALVLLDLADGPTVNQTERYYFMALSYMKLEDNAKALGALDKVIATNDKVLAPSSQFYKGVIFFNQASWEPAQRSFQAVLDSSSDAKLDERAENYIERILLERRLETERNQKWTISATVGEMYDSNILLISNSLRDSGTATDEAGWRSLLAGSLRYRPVYKETYEVAVQGDLLTMFTVNESFQTTDDLRNLDPTIATLTVPYTHKGTLFDKGYRLEITPGYESTYMSIENNETKSIINSMILGVSNLLVMNDHWYSTLLLGIRSDKSNLDAAVGDDDSSALRLTLGTSNMLISKRYKDHITTIDGGLTLNSAEGKNANYNRLDLGVGYLMPWKWDTTVNSRLAYFYLDYPDAALLRTDHSFTLSAGLTRKLNEIWSTGVIGSYNINDSNQEANTYNKFTALLTLSAAYGF